MKRTLTITTADEMLQLGEKLAKAAKPPLIIFLQGNLGAGKTTFVQGFIRALGYQKTVKSPTYTLVEPYVFSDFTVYHFDLYRLVDPMDLENIGFRDYFSADSICLIEWPERAQELMLNCDLNCNIEIKKTSREVVLQSHSERGTLVIQTLFTGK